MLAKRESSVVWVAVVVSIACGGRSVRSGDDSITFVEGGASGTTSVGIGGSMAFGGTPSAPERAGTGGQAVTGGAAGLGDRAGTSGLGGTAENPDGGEASPNPEPCDPAHDPLDPTSIDPCRPPEPPADDCDELAHEYEMEVGAAQWCDLDADCVAGIAVPATLHCACDVIVRSVRRISPIAAQWRAQGCVNERPCLAVCRSAVMPYRCGEAKFCVDDGS
jgi:hypothetical protein